MKRKANDDQWFSTFWGWIKLPSNIGEPYRNALAHIAWKTGIYEDCYKSKFQRWFRALAKRRPDLVEVKVFDTYPVDEFRWIGPYKSSSYWEPGAEKSS